MARQVPPDNATDREQAPWTAAPNVAPAQAEEIGSRLREPEAARATLATAPSGPAGQAHDGRTAVGAPQEWHGSSLERKGYGRGAPGAGPGRAEWGEEVQEYLALRQQAGGGGPLVQESLRRAVHACARASRWQAARDLVLDAEEAAIGGAQAHSQDGPGPTVGMYTDAIAACARAKQPKEALALLRRMESRGLQGNVVVYTAAISACARVGNWESGLWLLSRYAHGAPLLTTCQPLRGALSGRMRHPHSRGSRRTLPLRADHPDSCHAMCD